MRVTKKIPTITALAVLAGGTAGLVGGAAASAQTTSHASGKSGTSGSSNSNGSKKYEVIAGAYKDKSVATTRASLLNKEGFKGFSIMMMKGTPTEGTLGTNVTPQSAIGLGGSKGSSGGGTSGTSGASGGFFGGAGTVGTSGGGNTNTPNRTTVYVVTKGYPSEKSAKQEVSNLRHKGFIAWEEKASSMTSSGSNGTSGTSG